MNQPFIRNHQYNLIRKQVRLLQHTCQTVFDPKVVKSVRESVQLRIAEAFPNATGEQAAALEAFLPYDKEEQFQSYLRSLEPYLEPFPPTTEAQLRKLFPKAKKLKLPDLEAVDFRRVSYLGWTDIATNKLFLVYPMDGKLAGVEGRFTPANKKSTCFLCNKQEEVALFTATAKSKPAGASPDYYKAIGNYLCVDSKKCNDNLTEIDALERFLADVLG
ncbi:FusB/FusC family EF-G-binding protein [Cohnella xylanilytica]|uniref:FusB/FusC family EF-G-binding protein n=1 Tax=Cohnella xylanilytica TaxID=557555 RepID=A0A841UBE0_9BACL|nr:FusB/FusC family EF-G-binding protein [Cohnella xylanilytica]MBB6695543.1 FusB/FusC family EF-G-binding protein [Cohnella xylanilytica]